MAIVIEHEIVSPTCESIRVNGVFFGQRNRINGGTIATGAYQDSYHVCLTLPFFQNCADKSMSVISFDVDDSAYERTLIQMIHLSNNVMEPPF